MALANKVKHLAGDLVQFDTTPKYSSASNPAERAIQAVEEQARTIRADCQIRFDSGETFGADKPIWAWLLRHAGWQISRYKQKGNGMTVYKQAHGEHYTHEVVPFAGVVLVKVPKPTHRGLQGGKRWHKGDAVLIKGVWVGRSETSDEHIVLTPGGHGDWNRLGDTMLDFSVRWWDAKDGIVRGRSRKEPAPPPPVLVGENTQSHNPDLPDKTEDKHCETPKETDDTNDADNLPTSETPLNDGRDANHIKSKSSADAADGVRQRLKFDGEASGMTPDPKGSKETVKLGEIPESNALPDESPEKKKVRFLPDSGDGDAAAVTVEELVEYYWSDEHGQGEMFEGLHCKVEPDLDVINTEAALDRLLENGFVRDIPRDEGAGKKLLTTRWEKTWRKRNMSGSTNFASWDVNTDGRSSGKTCVPRELRTALEELWTFSRTNVVCLLSLRIARMLTIRLLSWMMWW